MRNIPKGYKQTEVGTIPNDWKVDKIKNLAHITTGTKNTQDRIDSGEYPFYVRSQTVERINSYSFDGEAILTAGDGVGTGKVFHYIKGKFDFHQRVYKVSDFKDEIDGYYFFLYFSNNFYKRIMQMTAKSSVDSVRMEMIAGMQIPHPPTKAEQTAIAATLSDADALINSLEKLIAKKRNIKQGTMQKLFKPKEGWVIRKLGEIGSFSKGAGIRKDESFSGTIPCIRYGEIYTRHNDYIKEYFSFISIEVSRTSKRLKAGDLLFAGSGETKEEIGKCVAFLEETEAYAGGDIVILSPQDVDPLFLGYYLNMPAIVKQKASRGQGDAVVHISAASLKEISINLPAKKSEQTAIAQVLSDMDDEIEALEQRLAKYRMIKQGMIQELLTGKTRLI